MGAFTHKYDTNFSGEVGTGTHYVVLAYELQMSVDFESLPNDQHSEYRWIHDDEEIDNVHQNSRAYFSFLTKMSEAQYSIINARRDAFNNLLWQTPVLSLVAQAFLFTIILNSTSSAIAVAISSFLAVITSVASRQLLDKHRCSEVEYARWLAVDERIKGIYEANRKIDFGDRWINLSAYRVWSYVLPMFGIAAIVALIARVMCS